MSESKQHYNRQFKICLHTDAQVCVEEHNLIDPLEDLATSFTPEKEAFKDKQDQRTTEKKQKYDSNELKIDHRSSRVKSKVHKVVCQGYFVMSDTHFCLKSFYYVLRGKQIERCNFY